MTTQEIIKILNFDNSGEIFSFCNGLDKLIDSNNIEEFISRIKIRFDCDKETANDVFIEYKTQIYDEVKKVHAETISSLTPQQIAHANAIARESLNKPKCPTCGSTKVKRISSTAKVAGAVAFGLFSKTARSQFKCENCGYKW